MLSSSSPVLVSEQTCDKVDYGMELMPGKRLNTPVETPVIICPLYNLGNTCYFNAGVQLLVNCPQFVYCLRDSLFRHPEHHRYAERVSRSCGKAALELFEAFTQLVNDMEFTQLEPDCAISPLRALECLSAVHPLFEGREQQDCPEMVNAVIANVAEVGRQEIELDNLLKSFEGDYLRLEKAMGCRRGDTSFVPMRCTRQRMEFDEISLQSGSLYGSDQMNRNGAASANHEQNENGSENNHFTTSAQTHNAPQFPVFPGSWWNFNTMRINQFVNRENRLLQLQEDSKNGKLPQSTFRPPKIFYNSVTDGFTGQILSEIRCHTCQRSSRIVESFSSLTIGIPSPRQRLQYAKKHPEVQRVKQDGTPQNLARSLYWRSVFSWFYAATRWIVGLFTGFSRRGNCPVTLQECLDIHFEPVELKGSNMYHCSTCNAKREATKQETLLTMPEYLLLHMKRFEQGKCFNTKKTDEVIFPMSWDVGAAQSTDVLRLRNYLNSNVLAFNYPLSTFHGTTSAGDSTPMENSTSVTTPLTATNDHQKFAAASSSPLQSMQTRENPDIEAPIDTYTLEAVVNHHGTIARGHYTTFARKKTASKDVWVYLNDEELSTTTADSVANSEEYLLLYKKQSLFPRSEAFEKLRTKARELLAKPLSSRMGLDAAGVDKSSRNPNSNTNLSISGGGDGCHDVVYISRPWLQRMTFMEEPGPILNRLSYRAATQETGESSSAHGTQSSPKQNLGEPTSAKGPPYEKSLPVEWFYVSLLQQEYDAFYDMYGGNQAVTQSEYNLMMSEQDALV
ncbi:ubiquitin carboxyl-terminal hydrolase [Trypanosoma brucei equiperdum]|uniref:Ubiquitin carboxyl-terminal hydrolase n=1 Tax=Trypanosoma brucei equiperdum TaxID=630700 RepID=A0A3L6KZN1_9TRYP|nr:ubiquitin carboxyl-terminal hydrolase [Trypanosoma brucei equiperdum]